MNCIGAKRRHGVSRRNDLSVSETSIPGPESEGEFFLAIVGKVLYIDILIGRCDGIGRRSGLKIRRWQHRGGSSPPTGTIVVADFVSFATTFFYRRLSLTSSLLLPKPDPLRWAPVLYFGGA